MRNKGQPDGIKIPEMFNIIQQCPKLFGISMTFVPSAAGQAAVYKLRKAQVTFPNVRMLGVSTYSQENSPLSLWARIISLFPEAQRLSLLTEQNLIDDKSSFEPASFYNLKELYLTNFVLKNAPAGSLLPKLLDPPSFAKIQRLGTSHPFYDLAAPEIKAQLKQLQWLGCGQPLAQEGPKYRPADVNLSTFAGLRWLRQLDLAGLAIKFPFAQIIAQVPSTLSNLDFQGDAQDIVDSAEKVMNQQFSFAPLQRKSLRQIMIWTESNGNAELKKKCEDSYTTFLIGAMLENVTLAVMVMCM